MTNSKKMNPQKLKDMLLKYALYIILLLLLVVIVAGTDLSVGRVLGLCAAVAASMLQSVTFASRYYPSITEPLPLILPFLVCVAIAVIISAFNGFGMAKLHMHPFIVTLGTQLISYGLCCIYIENQPSDIFGFKLPYLVIIFLLLGVVTWIVWNKTRFGKNMFAVGGNSEAAEVSGVSVTKTIMGVFLYAGLMYGIASFFQRRHRHRPRRRDRLDHPAGHQLRPVLPRCQRVSPVHHPRRDHHHRSRYRRAEVRCKKIKSLRFLYKCAVSNYTGYRGSGHKRPLRSRIFQGARCCCNAPLHLI